MQATRPPILRYGLAVVTVALATALTLLFPVIAERTVFILFFVAIIFSATH